jgi:hypothetical protein
LAAVFYVAAAGSYPTQSNLANSHFAAHNGSLDAGATSTLFDWNPISTSNPNGPLNPIDCGTTVPGGVENCRTDLVSSGSDESLGQGTKEDDSNVSVVSGQIPTNKDDLSRFYINHETVTTQTNCGAAAHPTTTCHFLYLAWERSNLLGSAHIDFELNQSNPGITSTAGSQTVSRTAGDVLIDFDFGGSGVPTLIFHLWKTTGATKQGKATECEAATTYPCWGKGQQLAAASYVASVNGSQVTDRNNPGAPRNLPGTTVTQQNKTTVSSTFGEAGINLESAGIFQPGACENIGYAWVKSRSSGSSFVSELKDFITPLGVDISNCGGITIQKVTDPSPDPTSTSFDYTASAANGGDTDTTSFSLGDGDSQDLMKGTSTQIKAGDYTVTETPDSNFTLTNIVCQDDSSTFGYGDGTTNDHTDFTDGDVSATIHLAAGEHVTCVFTNTEKTGAIQINKTSSKTGNPVGGAHFEVCTNDGPYDSGNPCDPAATGSDDLVTDSTTGVACVDGLAFGDYYVTETQAPTGYAIDDSSTSPVTVDTGSACDDSANIPSSQQLSPTDTPLADIQVNVRDAGSGETSSTITCTDGQSNVIGSDDNPATTGWDTSQTDLGLPPDTYTCTIVVDP